MELPPDDMQKLLVSNTVSIINIKISRWLSEVSRASTRGGTSLVTCYCSEHGFEDSDEFAGHQPGPLQGGGGRGPRDRGPQHEGGLLGHLHQPVVLRLQPRGPLRGAGQGDVGAGAGPHHRGAAERHEPLLHQPAGAVRAPLRVLQHRQPPAQVLTAAAKVIK